MTMEAEMKNPSFLLVMMILVLVSTAVLLCLPGSALAANTQREPVHTIPVVDPCWRCRSVIPDEPGGFRQFVPESAPVTTGAPLKPVSLVEPAAEPCVFVETKGPGGIRGITCWASSKIDQSR
jgi:hypothetical protein